MPKIFFVNWFRKGADGKFLWPGYGDNSHVLAWVFGRCDGKTAAVDSPIGKLPGADALDLRGLDLSTDAKRALLSVDAAAWKEELPSLHTHFDSFGSKMPQGLRDELAALEKRLG
jgi:phosphoenolpyruvate carboxykinase (GTP)